MFPICCVTPEVASPVVLARAHIHITNNSTLSSNGAGGENFENSSASHAKFGLGFGTWLPICLFPIPCQTPSNPATVFVRQSIREDILQGSQYVALPLAILSPSVCSLFLFVHAAGSRIDEVFLLSLSLVARRRCRSTKGNRKLNHVLVPNGS